MADAPAGEQRPRTRAAYIRFQVYHRQHRLAFALDEQDVQFDNLVGDPPHRLQRVDPAPPIAVAGF